MVSTSVAITPQLDERARGWLRFVWDKATTPDDWSSTGRPNAWWDRHSTPPMCSLLRFDLHETGYVLPVMCDLTPAGARSIPASPTNSSAGTPRSGR
jgi:hypothetical protein